MSETQQSEPTPTNEQIQPPTQVKDAGPEVKDAGPEVGVKRPVPTPPARATKQFLVGENSAIQVWRMHGSNVMKITFDRVGSSGTGVHTGLPHVDGLNPLDLDLKALLAALVEIQDRAAEDSPPNRREGLTHKLGGGLRKLHAEQAYSEIVEGRKVPDEPKEAPTPAPKRKAKNKKRKQMPREAAQAAMRRETVLPPPQPPTPAPEPRPLVRRLASKMIHKLLG